MNEATTEKFVREIYFISGNTYLGQQDMLNLSVNLKYLAFFYNGILATDAQKGVDTSQCKSESMKF